MCAYLTCKYGGVITIVDTPEIIRQRKLNEKIDEFVKYAVNEKRTLEGVVNGTPNNNIKYNTWFYGHEVKDVINDQTGEVKQSFAWCSVFVLWSGEQAGLLNDEFLPTYDVARKGYFEGVSNLERWYNGRGLLQKVESDYKPRKGDIAFFKGSHVGIVVAYDAVQDKVYTIEGNAGQAVRLQPHLYNKFRSFGINEGDSYGTIPDDSELNQSADGSTR